MICIESEYAKTKRRCLRRQAIPERKSVCVFKGGVQFGFCDDQIKRNYKIIVRNKRINFACVRVFHKQITHIAICQNTNDFGVQQLIRIEMNQIYCSSNFPIIFRGFEIECIRILEIFERGGSGNDDDKSIQHRQNSFIHTKMN